MSEGLQGQAAEFGLCSMGDTVKGVGAKERQGQFCALRKPVCLQFRRMDWRGRVLN